MTGAYDLRSHVDRFRASILTLLIFSFTKFGLNFASDDSFVFLVEQERGKGGALRTPSAGMLKVVVQECR